MNLLWLVLKLFSGSSTIVLILIQIIVSCALIAANAWYFKRRAIKRAASIEELEALFALRDPRELRRYRPRF